MMPDYPTPLDEDLPFGDLGSRLASLESILKKMGSVLVAFSGGCDSTFLLKMAHSVLGEGVAALTAVSPTYQRSELEEARTLAQEIGARHIVVDSHELGIEGFVRNSPRRCFYCKDELFRLCRKAASSLGLAFIADASNVDDLADFRPGREAARLHGVRSPLVEAGFTKEDIRRASRRLGLRTWDKPALACLASRIPYHTEITTERLAQVDKGEQVLRDLGFKVVRLRHHGDNARIEVGREEIPLFLDEGVRAEVVRSLKAAGFTYISLDLEGYRTGSMNEVLREKVDPAIVGVDRHFTIKGE